MSLFNNPEKPIGIGSDHAGFRRKQFILNLLKERGVPFKDFGTYSMESCDYPDYAHPLAIAVENGECYPGIAVCGSGNGINMTVNKHQGIRAALCWNSEIAYYARAHNDANILTVPGRFLSDEEVIEILDTFLKTSFEGGRHERRINKIPCI
ncbi:MAG: ribose 5-phosphate isomerase B [Proteiniphilum sp.]|nr:ribose 5-phosphate isomerase B [Proteiniphilum sp.]MDD3908795.1 ribose 5-phosphate isomerase B [Proteiniphilum sp.]MDD4417000.1 ribose 5-phosphate isomerase B [Proteiniphilum sp.]